MRKTEWGMFGVGVFMTIILALVLSFGTTANAAGPSTPVTPSISLPNELSMLTSKASMRSHQLRQSHHFYMGLYGNRVINDGQNNVWVYDLKPSELIDKVKSQTIKYRVTEPSPVTLTVQFYNNIGYPTCYGWKNTEAVEDGNGGVVLKENTIQMEVAEESPLEFSVSPNTYLYGISVKIFDKDGNIVKEMSLNIIRQDNGSVWVLYPSAFLGEVLASNGYTAELTIRTYDYDTDKTTTVVYDPASGKQKVGYEGNATVGEVSIKGVKFLPDNSDVMGVITTTNNIAENVLYKVKLTETKSVTLYCKTSEGAVAKGCTVRRLDEWGNVVGEEYFTNGSNPDLEPGFYDVWFDWNEGDLIDPSNYYWYYHWNYEGGGLG